MVDASLFFTSLSAVLQPGILMMILLGVTLGIIIGALPGLTATMGVALLVPLTFGRPPVESLSMLMGIYSGAMYGGSISAILIRTPGTPAAAATLLDGYPLAQRGEAGRAMSMSLFASFVGGLFGVAVTIFLSPLVSVAALEFSYVEYCALALLGLSVIASVSGTSVIKGMLAGALGLLLATIGFDPISGFPRFTGGQVDLLEGPPFIPVLIGLFAISEILAELQRMGTVQRVQAQLNQWWPSRADLKRSATTLLKSSAIGTSVGSVPGAGGDIAAFLAYGEAKRSARDPEQFGKGAIEGVAAAESANNACQGGAMIPLLSLGVPGDAITAVLLGAFVIQGLQPGPLLFKDHLDVVYSVFAAMLVGQFAMLLVGAMGLRLFAKVVMIRKSVLMPAILVLALVGAYSMRGNLFDVWVAIGCGVLGYAMQRYGYPLAPILLALILGPMAESNLRRALVISDGNFSILFSRPIGNVLFALAVASVVAAVWSSRRRRKV